MISIRAEVLRAAIGVRDGPSKTRKSLRELMNARRREQIGIPLRPDSYASENYLPAINYKFFYMHRGSLFYLVSKCTLQEFCMQHRQILGVATASVS